MSKKLWSLIQQETKRQQETLDLIPSENVADPELLKVLGTPLVNKYSEGYPERRYYGGNAVIDKIELLAQAEGLKAFKLVAACLPNFRQQPLKTRRSPVVRAGILMYRHTPVRPPTLRFILRW